MKTGSWDWTLHRKPSDGSTHWSCRRLASELGVNHMSVSRTSADPRVHFQFESARSKAAAPHKKKRKQRRSRRPRNLPIEETFIISEEIAVNPGAWRCIGQKHSDRLGQWEKS